MKEAQGEYCLALKENQKTAYQEIKEYFGCKDILKELMKQEGRYLKEAEHTAKRITIREYFITDDNHREEWEKPPLYLTPGEYEYDGRIVLYIRVPVSPSVCRCSGRIYDRNHEGDFDITNR